MSWLLRSAVAVIVLGSLSSLALAQEPVPPLPVLPELSQLPQPPAPVITELPPIPMTPPTVTVDVLTPELPPELMPLPPIPDFPVANIPGDALPAVPPLASAPAPPACRLCDAVCNPKCDPVWRLFPQRGRTRAYGWLNGGYVYNTSNPDSKFNGPYNSIDRSAEPMFNQGYFVIERRLPQDGSLGIAGRIDALFGYDFFLGQSRGLEIDRDGGQRLNGQFYGLAIPQAYVEVGHDRMSLKLGHFYTLVGYEVLPATGNFFYSHAYSYQFGQPFTFWGGVLTTQLTRNLESHVGLTNAWDTLVGRVNSVNFIGGLKYTPDSLKWWTSFAITSGRHQNNVAGLPNIPDNPGNRSRYSFLIGLTPRDRFCRWEYVFHHYYAFQENGTPQDNFARWYGIDQYLYYRMTEKVRLGGRFEWFRDEDGTRVGLNRVSNPNKPPLPGNYFSLTGGINYTPMPNLTVRPEVRWDFTSDTTRRAFNDGTKNNQLLFAFDVIWQF